MKFISLYNIIIESRLDDYKLQLKDDQLANSIFSLNNPKKQKMIIKWIKNGSIQYPQQKQLIDKVYQIINRKQLDYQTIKDPHILLNQYQQLDQKINYNPDNQKCFTNKVELGRGVVVYNVQDDEKGRDAVRRAVDYNWGKDSNPWCIIAKNENGNWKGNYWQKYCAIPKRICFKDGKLFAMCANDKTEIKWWNRNDISYKSLKLLTHFVNDDPNAQKEIKTIHYDENRAVYETDPNILKQLYQKHKDNKNIKINIAKNKHTSIELLQQLSNDKNETVRFYVDMNPNTPKEIRAKDQKK